MLDLKLSFRYGQGSGIICVSNVCSTFMSVMCIYACLIYEIFEGTIIFDVLVFFHMFLYQTLYSGEEKSCAIGQRDDHKLLNRFKNITVCK